MPWVSTSPEFHPGRDAPGHLEGRNTLAARQLDCLRTPKGQKGGRVVGCGMKHCTLPPQSRIRLHIALLQIHTVCNLDQTAFTPLYHCL